MRWRGAGRGARREQRLNQRLITAQDDERRRTALELHDEVGPSLFGLKANATSIATRRRVPERSRKLNERKRELEIIEHLQSINRSMLNVSADGARPVPLTIFSPSWSTIVPGSTRRSPSRSPPVSSTRTASRSI